MDSGRKQRVESERVVAFPQRTRPAAARAPAPPADPSEPAPVADLSKYQRAREEEDYRHRMIVNVVAFAFCIVLAIAGIWLIEEIAEMKRVQDCVLSGRAGCVPLDLPAQPRP